MKTGCRRRPDERRNFRCPGVAKSGFSEISLNPQQLSFFLPSFQSSNSGELFCGFLSRAKQTATPSDVQTRGFTMSKARENSGGKLEWQPEASQRNIRRLRPPPKNLWRKGNLKCYAADSKWLSRRRYKATSFFAAGFDWSSDNCSLASCHSIARLRHRYGSPSTFVLPAYHSCRFHL
jgi:hypothetical protein